MSGSKHSFYIKIMLSVYNRACLQRDWVCDWLSLVPDENGRELDTFVSTVNIDKRTPELFRLVDSTSLPWVIYRDVVKVERAFYRQSPFYLSSSTHVEERPTTWNEDDVILLERTQENRLSLRPTESLGDYLSRSQQANGSKNGHVTGL